MNIVSESLIKRSAARGAQARLAELRRVHDWAARLGGVGTIESVLEEFADSAPGDPVYRETGTFAKISGEGLRGFHGQAKDAITFLRFIADLDYDYRRQLIHRAEGVAVFERLATPEGMTQFRTASGEMKSVRFPMATDRLEAFVEGWPEFRKRAQVLMDGRRAAVYLGRPL